MGPGYRPRISALPAREEVPAAAGRVGLAERLARVRAGAVHVEDPQAGVVGEQVVDLVGARAVVGGRGALVLEEDEGAVAAEGLAGAAEDEVLGALDVDLEQVDAAVDRRVEGLEADLDR